MPLPQKAKDMPLSRRIDMVGGGESRVTSSHLKSPSEREIDIRSICASSDDDRSEGGGEGRGGSAPEVSQMLSHSKEKTASRRI
ncbi:hypothetical protein DMENIID0001_170250 [Sergentomyia squamirostris]